MMRDEHLAVSLLSVWDGSEALLAVGRAGIGRSPRPAASAAATAAAGEAAAPAAARGRRALGGVVGGDRRVDGAAEVVDHRADVVGGVRRRRTPRRSSAAPAAPRRPRCGTSAPTRRRSRGRPPTGCRRCRAPGARRSRSAPCSTAWPASGGSRRPATTGRARRGCGVVPAPVAISEVPPTAKPPGISPSMVMRERVPDRDDEHRAEAGQHQQAAEPAEPAADQVARGACAQVLTLVLEAGRSRS